MPGQADLVRKSKSFDMRFPAEVLRRAQALFSSYVDEEYKSNAICIRTIHTVDGEEIRTKSDEDFYFRHDDTATTATSYFAIQNWTRSDQPFLQIRSNAGSTTVGIDLCERDQVDNILQLFTREGSRLLGSSTQGVTEEKDKQHGVKPATSKLTVFVGHGHDPQWEKLRNFLERFERLNVTYYESRSTAGYATGEVLQGLVASADMAFLVHTAEDEDGSGGKHARENVVHEAGLFLAQIGSKRAIVLLEEGCSEYSNIKGIGQIRFPKGQIENSFGEVAQVLVREFPGRL